MNTRHIRPYPLTGCDGGNVPVMPSGIRLGPTTIPPTVNLADEFCTVRRLTEDLAAPLSAEDQTAQSMPDTSPTKWHRAHTTWFFETFVLEPSEADFAPVDPAYRVLFNSYYETVGPQHPRPERGVITRPGIAAVAEYRAEIDRRVHALLRRSGVNGDVGNDGDRGANIALAELVRLGLNHEQQHQELLLMDIKHVLSCNPLESVYRPQRTTQSLGQSLGQSSGQSSGQSWGRVERPTRWVDVAGGLVDIGHDGVGFSFDNEHPRHRVHLEPFRLADRLVTAGEWQAFIDDGGYERPELWLSDGWRTAQTDGWTAPLYWRRDGRVWMLHTLGGTRPVLSDEPACHVSSYEADAYARWAGARLPTEFEWEHAATTVPTAAAREFDVEQLHPVRAAETADGLLSELLGECWQWTASAYLPYPGFTAAAGAVGEYNGKFMSGQMVLRGSSALTPLGHTRSTYRNFFPPAARWPMAGVRLAAGAE